MKKLFLYTIFTTILVMQPLHAKDIIFDLDGVLIKTGKSSIIREFGIGNIADYYYHFKVIHEQVGIKLKEKFFQILDNVSTLQMPDAMQNYVMAFDEYGQRLPYFMCAWMEGSVAGSEIIAMVMENISQHGEWFEHPSEEVLITKLTRLLFTPERFVRTRKISRKGIGFIKALKRDGHRVYVLSNWDPDSFELITKENPELFKLFDGIVISGNIYTLKPHEKAYKTIIYKYNLAPENCIVIDDQMENLATASALKMDIIKVRKKGLRNNADFRLINKDLNDILGTDRRRRR